MSLVITYFTAPFTTEQKGKVLRISSFFGGEGKSVESLLCAVFSGQSCLFSAEQQPRWVRVR